MKPRAASSFIWLLIAVVLLLLAVLGVNMVSRIKTIEAQTAKAQHEAAITELKTAIQNLQSRIDKLSQDIGQWDESRQQFTDPTYYPYWRNRRVKSVKFIPEYVRAVELYDARGKTLRPLHQDLLPDKISTPSRYLATNGSTVSLYEFSPIYTNVQQQRLIGYLGVHIDFISALQNSYHFLHLDQNTLSLLPGKYDFNSDELFNNLQFSEHHTGELDKLKQVMFETYWYFVILVAIVMLALLYIVSSWFSNPLKFLDNRIRAFRKGETPAPLNKQFSVAEFNHLSQQLETYHNNWLQAQENLNELNNQLEKKVRERTIELESVIHELESFSYSVSHDLRSPLRAIDGYNYLLRDEYADKLDKRALEYIGKTREAIYRMADLIDDLLDLSKVSRRDTSFVRLNLSELVQQSVKKIKERHASRQVEVHIAPELYTKGDASLLTILLDNLLLNSWKYTAKTEKPVVEFGCQSQNDKQTFYVKDNGIGFDMAYSDKLFKPFQRLHGAEYDGTGIGLAICARVIKRHGGEIWADSKPGQGSVFYFRLLDA